MNHDGPARVQRLLVLTRDRAKVDAVRHAVSAAGMPRGGAQEGMARQRSAGSLVAYRVESAEAIDSALALLQGSRGRRGPFAVVLIDVDVLPSDADQAGAVAKLMAVDPDAQFIVCGGSVSGDLQSLGMGRLLLLRGPFEAVDAAAAVSVLVHKWFDSCQVRSEGEELRGAMVKIAALEDVAKRLQLSNDKLHMENEERRNAEARFRHSSLHDNLTGLPNRALLLERLDRALERCKRSTNYHFAILFIDLDNFKTINDTVGHAAGDSVLIEVSRRLTATLRGLDTASRPSDDTTARLGGDEFVILLDGLKSPADAEIVAGRVLQALRPSFQFGGKEFSVGATIGLAHGDADCDGGADILRNADVALYEAKDAGKATVRVFSRGMRDHVVSRHEMESALRLAVDRRQVRLQYQPIVCLESGRVSGFEALARWEHPVRGSIPPADFIPVAEELGVIEQIGQWVLTEACRQLQVWRATIPGAEDLKMSVNVSPIQMRSRAFRGILDAALAGTGLSPRGLILELTESACVEVGEDATALFSDLRDLGVRVYIDDFGCGFSTLNCLRALQLDGVKIDRAFVKELGGRVRGTALVEVMRSLASVTGKVVVAEGIETIEQLVQLQALGCEFGQGYFLSRPLDAAAAAEFLQKEHTAPVLAEVLSAAQRMQNEAA